MLSIQYLKRYIVYLCLAGSFFITSFSLVGCDTSQTVKGSVFVVNKGDDSHKLSFVNVKVYKDDVFDERVKSMDSMLTKRMDSFNNRIESLTHGILDSLNNDYHQLQVASLEAAPHSVQEENTFRELKELKRERMSEVLSKVSELRGKYHTLQVQSILKRLPKPHRSVKTGAEGEFSTTLETGEKYVFCATSQRDIRESTEYYAWIHEAKVEDGSTGKIMLSNDNLASVGGGALDWEKYQLLSSELPSISGTVAEDIARSTLEKEISP